MNGLKRHGRALVLAFCRLMAMHFAMISASGNGRCHNYTQQQQQQQPAVVELVDVTVLDT